MSWIHGLSERLKALVRRGQLERQLEEDIRFHIEMETEKNVRAGMTVEEARRAAERAFGRVEDTKESVRDERGVGMIENLMRETRFALRRLRRRPTFTAVVVITLGLGIGATTSIFSVVKSVLLDPLPYPNGERLVLLGHEYLQDGTPQTAEAHDRIVFRLPGGRPIARRDGSVRPRLDEPHRRRASGAHPRFVHDRQHVLDLAGQPDPGPAFQRRG